MVTEGLESAVEISGEYAPDPPPWNKKVERDEHWVYAMWPETEWHSLSRAAGLVSILILLGLVRLMLNELVIILLGLLRWVMSLTRLILSRLSIWTEWLWRLCRLSWITSSVEWRLRT